MAEKKKRKKATRKSREERTIFKDKSITIIQDPFGYTVSTSHNKSWFFSDELSLFKGLLRHQLRGEIAVTGLSDIGNYILVTERAVKTALETIKTLIDLKMAK